MFSILGARATPVNRSGAALRRTCDQCKLRKVRCDMGKPCQQCSDKDFNCSYNRVVKKRGPTGKRIESIRQQQNSGYSYSTEHVDGFAPSTASNSHGYANEYSLQALHDDHDRLDSRNRLSSGESTIGKATPIDPGLAHLDQSIADLASDGDSLISPSVASTISPLENYAALQSASTSFDRQQTWLPSLPIDSPTGTSDIFGSMFPELTPQVSAKTLERWPSNVNEETLLPWIDVYFKRLHPTIPILSRADMYREMLSRKHYKDPQYGAMLLSLCAFAMTQPVQIHEVAEAPSRAVQARMLIEESIKMRITADFGESPSIEMVLTSFFLFACLFGSGQHGAAWHRLREAIDLAQSLGVGSPSAYDPLDSVTREKWLRTYLVLSVTERAYAIQKRRSVSFRGKIGYNARFVQASNTNNGMGHMDPSQHLLNHDTDTSAITGLLFLAETFSAIDEQIIECWNGHCKQSDGICEVFDRRRAIQLFQAQRRAREVCVAGSINFQNAQNLALSDLPEAQQADISVTHFWLLNRLWLLCLSHGLLQSASAHIELRYDFAWHIASALWMVTKTLPFAAMEVHGVGLAEKIYDVALGAVTSLGFDNSFNLMAALTASPLMDSLTYDDELLTPKTLLQSLTALLNNFRGGDHDYGHQLGVALASLESDEQSAMHA